MWSSLGREETFHCIPFQLILSHTVTDLAIQILALKIKNSYWLSNSKHSDKIRLGIAFLLSAEEFSGSISVDSSSFLLKIF